MEGARSLSAAMGSDARRRFKVTACLLLGLLVLSAVITCGYFAYKKIKDSAADNTESIVTSTMLSNDELDQSPKATQRNNVSTTTQSTKKSGSVRVTLSGTGQSQSQTFYTSTDFSGHTKSSTLTSTTKPTASLTNMASENTSTARKTAMISTGATSFTFEQTPSTIIAVSIEQTNTDVNTVTSLPEKTTITFHGQASTNVRTTSTESLTISSTEHSSTHGMSTARVLHSCSMHSTSALNLNISDTDPCLSSSVLCNNESAFDTVPNYCECTVDGIWTIIQKRFDGSVNFCRNWVDYKMGFGDLKGEFWLGNDIIYQMTSSAIYKVKIYITDWKNETKYAMYSTFSIADEVDGYRLSISDHSGDAGDALTLHNGQMFSTNDRDNDDFELGNTNLALYFSAGWWFGPTVNPSSLNGPYQFEPDYVDKGIMWEVFSSWVQYPIKETKMLVKLLN